MKTLKRVVMVLSAALLTACGGGGGGATGSSAPPAATVPPPPPVQAPIRTAVTLNSDPGDTIGQGKAFNYTVANAEVTVTALRNHLTVTVAGDEQWSADFQTGGTDTELKAGMYADLDAYVPSAGPAKGGLRWYGEGRGCATSKGWFAIDSVTYVQGIMKSISLRFERHCDGAAPALRGVVEFSVDDKAAPAQPVNPPPSDLWRPPAGFGAGAGNEVYLESSAGDYVGLGKTYRYDGSNSDVWAASGYQIYMEVHGDEVWSGTFKVMTSLPRVQAGYYPNLRATPFESPLKGGMMFTGEGRGCSTLQGWFVVDAITYGANGLMTELDLRFEQHCEGRAAPLRGAVHWRAPVPANPVTIAPSAAGSWWPPATATAPGNYLYLEGDPTGSPRFRSRHLLSSANAVFSPSLDGGFLQLEVNGDQQWFGNFHLNGTGGELKAGLYDGLSRFQYPTEPANSMSWTGESRGCAESHGWLAIDSIAFTGGKLSAIDVRFEQVCDGAPEPFHGVLHWRAGETVAPPGPAAAPPEFWQPPSQAVPASGNYLYLAPDRDDHIAGGANYRYTPADSVIAVSETGGHLVLRVDGDEHWTADFQPMSSLDRLQPGYYPGLAGFYVRNPAAGGFSFGGEGHGCNVSGSGVVIDSVSYENGQLSAIALRFEQHCEIGHGALRGALRWSAADRTAAPGPVTAPASLWRPAAGATPASGSYVYLQSDAGDFIGEGKTWLHTLQNAPLAVSTNAGRLSVSTGDPLKGWQGEFAVMNSLTQLQPGFYDRLMPYPIFNPARGGFRWSGMGHGCNTGISWVAIDSVTYVAGKLASLHARFEQHCDFSAPALHGEIHWEG